MAKFFIPVSVYSSGLHDSTLDGVSKTHESNLVVESPTGNISLNDVSTYGLIVLQLQTKTAGDRTVKSFREKGEKRWTMFGGNFAYSNDSRFRQKYGDQPIAIHDRIENKEKVSD